MATREITLKVKGEADLKQITNQLGDLGKSYDKIKVQFQQSAGATQKQVDLTGNSIKQLGSEFKNLGAQVGLAFGLGEVLGVMKQFGSESIAAARESAGATAQLEAVLKSTGGVAGMTKGKLDELATSLQKTSMFSDEAVMGAESLLLTFKNVGATVFPQATQSIVDMSQAMGQDLKSSAIQIGKALNDPVEGISALTRVGVTFTEAQKQQIAEMVRFGDVAGAQKIILAELNSEFGGSALAAREAAGGAQDLAVSYGNLQEKFGGMMLAMANSEAAGAAVTFLDKLAAGAEAYSVILNTQIPAIQAHEAALAADAAKVILASDNYDELDNATDAAAQNIDSFRSALLANVGSHEEYQSAVDKVAQSNIELAGQLDLTAEEFSQLKTEVASTGPAAQAFVSHLNAMQTAAVATAKAQAKLTAEIRSQQAAESAAAAGYGEMTNRQLEGLQALANARAGMPEAQTEWSGKVKDERADEARKAQEDLVKDQEKSSQQMGKAMSKSFDDAAGKMTSTIESVLKPSLDEVWKPSGQEQHIDEWARRLATVSSSGFGSEWLSKLQAQFGGQDFFKPIADAMASGDEGALKAAADNILTNSVTKLWDPEIIKQKVKEQLQQQNLREELIKQVQAELGAEGLQVDPAQIAQASGDATGAANQLSQSFQQTGQNVSDGLEPANAALGELDMALQSTQTNLATFVSEVSSKFKSAADKVIGFQSTIKTAKWGDVGSAIVKGLVAGINANLYQVNEVLKDLAKEAIDSARDELGIKSPSKEFFDIADMIIQGLVGGIDSKGASFQKAISNLLQIDRDTFNLKDMVGFAADEVEEVMEGMNVEDSKVKFALDKMKDALRANLSTVASGSGAELKKVLADAVGSWEKAGFSGEAGKGLASGMDAFVSQIIALRTEFPKMAEAARAANLQKIFGGIGKFANEATGGADELAKRIAVLQTQIRQGGTSFNVEGQIMDRGQAQGRLNELIGQQTSSIGDMDMIKKIQQTLGGIQSGNQLTALLNSPQQMSMPQIAMTTKAILDSLIGQMGTLVKQNNNNFTLNITSQTTRENLMADFELLQSLLPSST